MNALFLAALLATPGISRDTFGVPTLTAPRLDQAFRLAGEAAAQDRLWQMEMSRRAARGSMAEIRGKAFVDSDREIRLSGYTDAELLAQVRALPPAARDAWSAYAEGINANIKARKQANALPVGYKELGFEPEPWTVEDSAAIAVMMARRFGFGGAGELRNYAFLTYLKTQPAASGVAVEVLRDIAWWNDPAAITTVSRAEDPQAKDHLQFPEPSLATSKAQVDALPRANLLELASAIRLASAETSTRVAQSVRAPYKAGSYAAVISGAGSKSKKPLMLGAPQMGHGMPSVIFEQRMATPSLRAEGMAIPGIPGIVLGRTPSFSWTLTSGVGDLADIFFFPRKDADHYLFGEEAKKIERVNHIIKVKGEAPVTVTQQRTHWGPVILDSRTGNALYVQRSTLWMRELVGFGKILELQSARDGAGIRKAISGIPLSFNFFYATAKGEIGWRFCGDIPLRANGLDPRFPARGTPANDWKGMIPANKMPYVVNPKSGRLLNWNNKPAAWWPNFDTPIWGELFRVSALHEAMKEFDGTTDGLVEAAAKISRSDEATGAHFAVQLQKALRDAPPSDPIQLEAMQQLNSVGMFRSADDVGARIYDETNVSMQELLFSKVIGSALGNLRIIAQPTLVNRALEGKTEVDYLAGRAPAELWRQAFFAACARLKTQLGNNVSDWGYQPGTIRYGQLVPIPHVGRGTFISLMDWGKPAEMRTVAGPGQTEIGPHSTDQADLVRNWQFKRQP